MMTRQSRRVRLAPRARNAVTESWDEGLSQAAIAALHGLSAERVSALLLAARHGYASPEAEAAALAQAKARKATRR
jgi:DNA-directed RNA polymerase specialized sigma24 family protein